jgi:hypothetical protein
VSTLTPPAEPARRRFLVGGAAALLVSNPRDAAAATTDAFLLSLMRPYVESGTYGDRCVSRGSIGPRFYVAESRTVFEAPTTFLFDVRFLSGARARKAFACIAGTAWTSRNGASWVRVGDLDEVTSQIYGYAGPAGGLGLWALSMLLPPDSFHQPTIWDARIDSPPEGPVGANPRNSPVVLRVGSQKVLTISKVTPNGYWQRLNVAATEVDATADIEIDVEDPSGVDVKSAFWSYARVSNEN